MHDDDMRQRVRRRRLRGSAAVLVAAAAAGVAVGTVLPGGHSGGLTPAAGARHERAQASSGWYPAGPLPAADAGPTAAPYYVTVVFQRSPAPVIVGNAFTGRVLATVSAPVPGLGFTGVAAAGDDRTFVLAAQETSPATVVFYELRLTAGGRVASLTRLLSVSSPGVPGFALSADASRLAYVTTYGIRVVSLATGASRTWTADGHTVVGRAGELSWAGDQTLALYWASVAPGSRQTGIRLLNTSAPGGDLLSSRLIIGVPEATAFGQMDGLSGLLITSDGSKVFATAESGQPDNPGAEVVEFSARTGQALAVVSPRAGESGMGTSCGALWTDPSGEQLTAECGGAVTVANGHFTAADLRVPSYNFSSSPLGVIAW
ncbi:MAG TPA: hypothetical protein VME19_03780 [Streptosporangiaceae bacterium]|nr:hypothetical protein [Streptosporangiaceae bacterium]